MANVADYKGLQQPFANEIQKLEVTYDFALDAGAVGTFTLFTAASAIVVHRCVAKVKTAGTSAGSATVAVAKNASGAGGMAATAVASLTTSAVIAGATGLGAGGLYLAAADTIDMLIATADLTAGKITFEFWISKA